MSAPAWSDERQRQHAAAQVAQSTARRIAMAENLARVARSYDTSSADYAARELGDLPAESDIMQEPGESWIEFLNRWERIELLRAIIQRRINDGPGWMTKELPHVESVVSQIAARVAYSYGWRSEPDEDIDGSVLMTPSVEDELRALKQSAPIAAVLIDFCRVVGLPVSELLQDAAAGVDPLPDWGAYTDDDGDEAA